MAKPAKPAKQPKSEARRLIRGMEKNMFGSSSKWTTHRHPRPYYRTNAVDDRPSKLIWALSVGSNSAWASYVASRSPTARRSSLQPGSMEGTGPNEATVTKSFMVISPLLTTRKLKSVPLVTGRLHPW